MDNNFLCLLKNIVIFIDHVYLSRRKMTVDVIKKLYRWGMYNPIHMLLNTAHYIDLFGHSNISDHYDITIRRKTELAIWSMWIRAIFGSPLSTLVTGDWLGFTTAGEDNLVYSRPFFSQSTNITSWGSISPEIYNSLHRVSVPCSGSCVLITKPSRPLFCDC